LKGEERKRRGEWRKGEGIWENFCEQKFSQPLSKNFGWGTMYSVKIMKNSQRY